MPIDFVLTGRIEVTVQYEDLDEPSRMTFGQSLITLSELGLRHGIALLFIRLLKHFILLRYARTLL